MSGEQREGSICTGINNAANPGEAKTESDSTKAS